MARSSRALSLLGLVALSTVSRPGGSQPANAPPPLPERASSAAVEPSGSPPSPPRGLDAQPARSIDPARARSPLEKLVADVQQLGGRIGAVALDVMSGATIASFDEHGLYNPASNAKLMTAAAALRLLGPGFRYLTGLYGDVSDGDVAELVLRGGGDPSLETHDLWEMARDLRAAGVRKVGAIAIDQSYFDDRYVPPAFEQQPDEWASFRAPVAAVSLNANTALFTVRPTRSGEAASVSVDPPGFVSLDGSVRTAGQSAPESVGIRLEPQGMRLVAHLSGRVPEGGRAVSIVRRVDDPRLLAAHALKDVLLATGIEVTGALRLGGERQKHLLVAHRSRPLGELLHALGKESDNFYAETIFKTLAAERRGAPGTAAAAAELVTEVLDGVGALERGLVIKNGSGLFDASRVSPSSMTALLRAALRDPSLGADFTAQLAIGGVDGTLRGRFRDWAKQRAVRAKTGTLASVVALSGYILPPPGGSPVAFSILVNGVHGKIDPARKAIDAFVGALAIELWKGAR